MNVCVKSIISQSYPRVYWRWTLNSLSEFWDEKKKNENAEKNIFKNWIKLIEKILIYDEKTLFFHEESKGFIIVERTDFMKLSARWYILIEYQMEYAFL